ncbi:MAG TPA: translation initiation factor IF-1 [Bryobacteraceae bacterium]
MSESGSQTGVVIELLPSAGVRVKLENDEIVLAHAAGTTTVNFSRLRPGDRVRVELSPRDKSRGRIVALLKS